MTPYDVAKVDEFVTAIGADVLPFLTLIEYRGTGLAPAECYRMFQRFCNVLSAWERCEVVHRLHRMAEWQLLSQRKAFTNAARAADDAADAAVALADKVL